MKIILGLFVAIFAIGYFAGFIGSDSFSRVVGKPPAEVADSLQYLDITRDAPGEVGTDPSRSGGVKAETHLEKSDGELTWVVMSGDKVATRMTAILEPVEGGTKTRVTTRVQRGDAPDDFVPPTFRSEKLTHSLFAMAVETKLDRIAIKPASARHCQELVEKFQEQGMDRAIAMRDEQPRNLKEAVGNTSAQLIRLNEMQTEMRRNGCPIGFSDPARPPEGTGSGFKPEMRERNSGDEPRFGEPAYQ